jgi:hypothetical protein
LIGTAKTFTGLPRLDRQYEKGLIRCKKLGEQLAPPQESNILIFPALLLIFIYLSYPF